MAEHTPGPWVVIQGPDSGGTYIAAQDTHVCNLYYTHGWTGNDVALENAEANARLIAAAPDLLEALTRVMEWISGWDPNFSYDSCWPADRDKARAAIARATGEK